MDISELAPHGIARGGLLLAKDLVQSGADTRLLRVAREKGALIRVHRGAYVDAARWNQLSPRMRYGLVVRAASLTLPASPVLSHHSAAALWGLPIIGPWPNTVHAIMPREGGGRSTRVIVRHDGVVEDPVELLDGFLVTSVARTLIDLARTSSFVSAVASMDHALRPDPRHGRAFVRFDELESEFDRMLPFHGAVKARRVMDFSDGLSGSPGESLSRVRIHELRFPAPILQRVFVDREGRMIVDFWWPDLNLTGEFDGLAKYHRPEFMSGLTIEGVVVKEKLREDRIRRLGPGMARWTWNEALATRPLEEILFAAGLPRRP